MKKSLLLILPMLMIAALAMAETCLTVIPLEGTEKLYSLQKIGQVRFAADVMYLYDKSGTELGHTALADVSKIVFQEGVETGVSNVKSQISVFPNPAAETLTVSGLNSDQTIRVYALDGMMLKSATTSNGAAQISVAALPKGAYLLQVGAEVVKFIKE